MTEKEKRDAGEFYNVKYDGELLAEQRICKDLCHEFNHLLPSKERERVELIRKILGRTGNSFVINTPFWCDYGYNIEIGENFYANHNCIILDCAKVIFGDNVFIGPNCCFAAAGHPADTERRNEGLEFARRIEVGNNVWIGAGTVVLPGISIGVGAVIGAGSVVVKDIPAGMIAVGNPCRVLRSIENGAGIYTI